MRTVCFPYRQSEGAVEAGPWQLDAPEGPTDLPESHQDWDASVDVRLRRTLKFDGERLLEETGVGPGASVRLVGGWYCETARSRSYPWRHDIKLPNSFEGVLQLTLPAGRLSTSVDLLTGVVLISPTAANSAVAARISGSWLWRDTHELRLEGTTGRFPMEWTDFAASGLPAEAGWYLDWPAQDFDAPVLGALRLQLNATNQLFPNALKRDEHDPERRLLVQTAMLDVAKQLVFTALHSDEFIERADTYPEGSVGFSVRLLIKKTFPGAPLRTLREHLLSHTGDFHVRFQAKVAPLHLDTIG